MTDDHETDELDMPTSQSRWGRRGLGVVAAAALLGLGALGGAFWQERRATQRDVGHDAATPRSITPAAGPTGGHADHAAGASSGGGGAHTVDGGLEITLTPEALRRAGIKTAPVRRGVVKHAIEVPATIAPNAYRETKVNALVGGIARAVHVELGATVERGQPLAVIFSNELADAQTRYLSLQAMLTADAQKLQRTRRLADIGAASRQELEEVTAATTARETEVAAARQKLMLLGLSREQVHGLADPAHVVSEVIVASPSDGVVIARTANPGQVVAPGQDLFVVADLSTVWVIADLYEKDFAAVRVGTPATVTVGALGGRVLRGRVAYIDPRVDPVTRTAKVRVEAPNPAHDLRLGMFVQVAFEHAGGQSRLVVPRAAVQTVGSRSVVYVALDDEGRFVERAVKLGADAGEAIDVLEGLAPGERIVTEGSFFLRAEASRARGSG